jgi:vacuolar-type H+-ATPase subunit D/Vma8
MYGHGSNECQPDPYGALSLKTRLRTATRGHKLLKDKRDDMMKKFLELVRENMELREKVEEKMKQVYGGFSPRRPS